LQFRSWLRRRENNHTLEFAASCVGSLPRAAVSTAAISSNLQRTTTQVAAATRRVLDLSGSRRSGGPRHPSGDIGQAGSRRTSRGSERPTTAVLNRLPDVTSL